MIDVDTGGNLWGGRSLGWPTPRQDSTTTGQALVQVGHWTRMSIGRTGGRVIGTGGRYG